MSAILRNTKPYDLAQRQQLLSPLLTYSHTPQNMLAHGTLKRAIELTK